jgi:hypothetical protein
MNSKVTYRAYKGAVKNILNLYKIKNNEKNKNLIILINSD